MMKIEQWALVYKPIDPYKAPELHVPQINGNVFGNPRFNDGDNITTSLIKESKYVDGRLLIETKSGSLYELGEVSAEYEARFPGAKERIIESLIK